MAIYKPHTALVSRAVRNKKFEMQSAHFHDANEVYYLVDGKTNYLVADRLYQLTAGDIMFVPRGVYHKTNSEGSTERILLMLPDGFLDEQISRPLFDKKLVKLSKKARTEIVSILEKIEIEQNRRSEHFEKMQKLYVNQLVIIANRSVADSDFSYSDSNAQLINEITEYIGENYANDITLISVSKRFGISSAHLSRLFKGITGIGFNEYLTDVRISHAEKFLHDKMTVSETSRTCGFNDPNYFSAVIKKHKGISPKKYQLRKK
jgi:AraC-like DNA-binding protein